MAMSLVRVRNTYSGVQQDGQKLFGTLSSTLMACADEGVMKQETAT